MVPCIQTDSEQPMDDLTAFRRHAHQLVDWMADYLETVGARPVRAQVRPGEIAGRLPEEAPAEGEPFARILADLDGIVMPGITHWQHPRFFAYFPANSSPPSVLAEMVTATLAAQCMLWQTSPAATELETRILDWLRRLCALPEGFAGVIQDTASSATLCALLVGRERATGWRSNEDGLSGQAPITAYTSVQAHSSVEKAATIAGLGRRNLRAIEVDASYAMRPRALEDAISEDLAAGRRPAAVVATLGTTGVGAVDPLRPIGEICARHNIYLHVDAAWAGSALLLPEQRGMVDGIELADGIAINPHKWLLTNFDCTAHFVRDPDTLIRTFSILPAYLQSRETGAVIDYRDWGIPLGRRFRALKLWFVLRSYGAEALRAMLRRHIAWTENLARRIEAEEDFELTSPANLALLSFRHCPAGLTKDALDAHNQRLLETLNDDGRIYFTPNRLDGRTVIRFAIGARTTTEDDVMDAWRIVTETASRLARPA
jgi:aromatic-L-amino-acid decarboxylase